MHSIMLDLFGLRSERYIYGMRMYEEFARCFITADAFCVSLNFRFNAFVLNRISQHRKRRTISLQAPF